LVAVQNLEAEMRGYKSELVVLVALVTTGLSFLQVACGSSGSGNNDASPNSLKVVLLQTNDIHSQLQGHDAELDYTPATAGDDQTIGGMSRLAARIAAARAGAGNTPVMLLDSGDFLMGSPFELLATPDAPELMELQALNYDAITLGNHEFDWTPDFLYLIVTAAGTHGFTVPIVASNIQLDPASTDTLAGLLKAKLLPKLVKTLPNGLKVGIFGLLGANAVQVTPTAAPFTFDAIATTAAAMVTELRAVDHVDLVVALSHSGINQAGQGEDADLALAVPGIDVILSGHTHDSLTTAVTVGTTVITQTGRYGEHLGKLELTVDRKDTGNKVTLNSYNLIPIDDSLTGDAATQTRINGYIEKIDGLLAPLAYAAPLAKTTVDVPGGAGETAIGDLVTDAYRAVSAGIFPDDPPVIGIDAAGAIRAPIAKGKTGVISFADAFRVLPLGIGLDQQPGYPLVTFYLNAGDLRAGLELALAPEIVGPDFVIQASGVTVRYDNTQLPFQHIVGLSVGGVDLDLTDTTHCYRVVTTLYVGGFLPVVSRLTGGALSVVPKQKDCSTVVSNIYGQIVTTGTGSTMAELKAWQALVTYLRSFPADAQGTPALPTDYLAGGQRFQVIPYIP
jgi:5'-nucleotidase/UDP-sugar diphosphatase